MTESLNSTHEIKDVLKQRLLSTKMYLSLSFWLAFRLLVTLLALLKMLLLKENMVSFDCTLQLLDFWSLDCYTLTKLANLLSCAISVERHSFTT